MPIEQATITNKTIKQELLKQITNIQQQKPSTNNIAALNEATINLARKYNDISRDDKGIIATEAINLRKEYTAQEAKKLEQV